MESVKLSEFIRNVSSWPKTKMELANVAERVALLLDVPFAAVYAVEGRDEKIGIRINGSGGGDRPDQDLLEDPLKRQIRQVDDRGAGSSGAGASFLKQIQIGNEVQPWATYFPGHYLTFAPIQGIDSQSLASGGVSKKRIEVGKVIVASPKALGAKEEILLLAVAQRLSELSKIAQLEQAIQIRSQFLSIASHELKTPLTSIYGVLQLQERMARLKKEEPQPGGEDRGKSFLKIVIRQVERLNELIDGLLDVSRIQNNRFMVEPAEVDVAAILNDTVSARLAVIAQEAGVKLQVEAPSSLVATVDPVRMEEVITNLVMNAIRFSPEGGMVWIRLRDDADAFTLTVRDQGPAVPVEDRERIFQPFERAARTSRFGGLGLGLFISRQIAQLHGGNVSLVESVPGKGNVFEARLPSRQVSVISA